MHAGMRSERVEGWKGALRVEVLRGGRALTRVRDGDNSQSE